jgi:dihydropteroate synthase
MLPSSFWTARRRALPLSKPLVMGILNVTPDSFSDGGEYNSIDAALAHASVLLSEGADILDIGGESTRPGFSPVSAGDELLRVVPAVERIRQKYPECWISIDTIKPSVAAAALEAGADIINDVSGAADPETLKTAQRYNAGYVATHGWNEHLRLEAKLPPSIANRKPRTASGIGEWVLSGLQQLLETALAAGIPSENIALDPGFGFGKKGAQNAALLTELPAMAAAFAQPLLVGVSRKHFLRGMYPQSNGDSDAASVLCAAEALAKGVKIFRVHNVALTRLGIGEDSKLPA